MVMWAADRFKRYGRLGQSIGIDETNTFQLTLFSSTKIVGATGLGSLWALEWAWHILVTNFHYVQGYET